MNIVLDGPDNAGKSTLAAALSRATGYPIKDKEGRPPNHDALLQKIQFYLTLDGLIIDRHPVISQSVYGFLRHDQPIPYHLIERFHMQDNLIIYCRCVERGLEGHEPSNTDTPDHLEMLQAKQVQILQMYDSLMNEVATIWYRRHEELPRIVAAVKGVTG
jgi:hypothetical protein